MATSIYSMTQISSTSSAAAMKGLSGLASGLDTEELIKAMTAGTRSKIAKAQSKQQGITWKTEAYQSITSALLDFKNKYMSSTSASNIFSSNFFQNSTVTSVGQNASAVKITGATAASVANFSVTSITSLAKTASFSTTAAASSQALTTGAISFAPQTVSKLEGESLNMSLGGEKFNIKLEDIATDGDQAQNIAAAINRGIEKAGYDSKVVASVVGGQVQLNTIGAAVGTELKVEGAGKNIVDELGIAVGASTAGGDPITSKAGLESTVKTTTFNEALKGKSIMFDLNGTQRTISFGDNPQFSNVAELQAFLNDEMKKAYGTMTDGSGTTVNKVSVDLTADGNGLTFKANDATSILSLGRGADGVTDTRGVLQINTGAANRLLLDKSLSTTNLNASASALFNTAAFKNGTESQKMTINGTEFSIYNNKIVMNEGTGQEKTVNFDSGTTVRDIMNTVNNQNLGMKLQYNATTDSFSALATESGTYGKVEIDGGALATALFGTAAQRNNQVGEDAVLTVNFGGGAADTTITRSSNNFSLNGMNVTLNNTFAAGTGDVTFTSKMNTDSIINNIKEMVTAYNDLIAKVNKELTTKPDRNYAPLSAEQRSELSEEEAKIWDTKSKEGLLFSDSIISQLATDLRFVFSMPVDGKSMSSIGITSSSAWSDNGKLIIDENKLRAALESDPEGVRDLFTKATTGAANSTSTDAGAMTRLDSVMSKYTATIGTKGLLIDIAGHESSPLSILNNSMQRQHKEIQKQLDALNAKLLTEQARYSKQFSSLEVYIGQMNSQSSWLSQAFGSN